VSPKTGRICEGSRARFSSDSTGLRGNVFTIRWIRQAENFGETIAFVEGRATTKLKPPLTVPVPTRMANAAHEGEKARGIEVTQWPTQEKL